MNASIHFLNIKHFDPFECLICVKYYTGPCRVWKDRQDADLLLRRFLFISNIEY